VRKGRTPLDLLSAELAGFLRQSPTGGGTSTDVFAWGNGANYNLVSVIELPSLFRNSRPPARSLTAPNLRQRITACLPKLMCISIQAFIKFFSYSCLTCLAGHWIDQRGDGAGPAGRAAAAAGYGGGRRQIPQRGADRGRAPVLLGLRPRRPHRCSLCTASAHSFVSQLIRCCPSVRDNCLGKLVPHGCCGTCPFT